MDNRGGPTLFSLIICIDPIVKVCVYSCQFKIIASIESEEDTGIESASSGTFGGDRHGNAMIETNPFRPGALCLWLTSIIPTQLQHPILRERSHNASHEIHEFPNVTNHQSAIAGNINFEIPVE